TNLGAFTATLFDEVCQGAVLAAIEYLAVDEHRLVFPLTSLSIFLTIRDRKTKFGNLSTSGKRACFRIACQPPNQNHFIKVGHDLAPAFMRIRASSGITLSSVGWRIKLQSLSRGFTRGSRSVGLFGEGSGVGDRGSGFICLSPDP